MLCYVYIAGGLKDVLKRRWIGTSGRSGRGARPREEKKEGRGRQRMKKSAESSRNPSRAGGPASPGFPLLGRWVGAATQYKEGRLGRLGLSPVVIGQNPATTPRCASRLDFSTCFL